MAAEEKVRKGRTKAKRPQLVANIAENILSANGKTIIKKWRRASKKKI